MSIYKVFLLLHIKQRAIELNICIVTYQWIKSVWETNLKDYIPAKDKVFDEFKCPVFLNLVVTSTNLNKKIKEDVKKMINQNGGVSSFLL